jgi:type I restriction enzyme, S subunit
MGVEWLEKSIEELTEVTSSKRIHASDYTPIGVPFYRSKEIIEKAKGKSISTELFISDEQFNSIATKFGSPQEGDILLTSVGTLGVPYLVQANEKFYFKDGNLTWLKTSEAKVNSDFIYYWLTSSRAKQAIDEVTIGSTQQALTIVALKSLKLNLPPLPEQQAIAGILGALDDKIELNRRMNETLESMARAIFKSWFVDFDPVRAKMDGQQPPGMNSETAALFPDSFEEQDGEMAPKGWEVGRLDELLVLQRGFDLPKKNRKLGAYPVFAAGGHHGTHIEFKVNGPGVVTGRSGVLGNVYYVHEDFWPLNTTLWIKEFRASRPIHTYFFLQTMELERFNAGSAVPTLNRNHVHGVPVIVPPLEIVERFEDFSKPLFERIFHNKSKSQTLANLRDTLLPKLLSGELRVPEAEKQVEEVV